MYDTANKRGPGDHTSMSTDMDSRTQHKGMVTWKNMCLCLVSIVHRHPYSRIYDSNNNVCPVFHHFSDIRIRNAHVRDLNLWNRAGPNVNTLIESP